MSQADERARQSQRERIARARAIWLATLSVSIATFWRTISYAYRSAAIDRQALINRSDCINGYNIRNADIRKSNVVHMYCSTFELQYICTIAERHNGIIMMLWFLVNNNGSVIMQYYDSVICGYEYMLLLAYAPMSIQQ